MWYIIIQVLDAAKATFLPAKEKEELIKTIQKKLDQFTNKE